ncbi:MAG: DNA polymerase III subunit [Actinomycetota bacterium]
MGHPRVLGALRNASCRPIGTYLFIGPAGTGKRSAARMLAAALVCPSACGDCAGCSRASRDIHPDVMVLQPEGFTFPVEALRSAASAAAQTPLEGAHRVFIVEEAGRVPERSQNALLKALEEPNPSVVWILLAESAEQFLPTILSRCQIVNFPPLAQEAVVRILQNRFGLEEASAYRHYRQAHGDPACAVRLAGSTVAGELRRCAIAAGVRRQPSADSLLSEADAIKELAAEHRAAAEKKMTAELIEFEEVAGGQPGNWRKKILERNKRVLRRIETEVFLDYLGWLGSAFRDLALASAGVAEEVLIAGDFAGELSNAGDARPTAFWIEMVDACLDGQLAIMGNANPALVTESVLLRLAS